MAFCLAHPGMLRRMFFGVIETYFNKNELGSYGSCDKPAENDCDIYLPTINDKYSQHVWDTLEGAKEQIDTIIENYERG